MRVRRALAVGSVVLLLAACGGKSDDAASANPTCPDGKIRFGVEPFEDPAKLTPAVKVLGEALRKKLNCPVNVQITEDYSGRSRTCTRCPAPSPRLPARRAEPQRSQVVSAVRESSM